MIYSKRLFDRPRRRGNHIFIPARGTRLSQAGNSAVSYLEVPDGRRRTFRRGGNAELGRGDSDASHSTRAPNRRFTILNHWSANGFYLPSGHSVSAIFSFFVPFCAILGRFVSETQAGDDPCGPFSGHSPDRRWVHHAGRFGPFWTVLDRFEPPAKPKQMRCPSLQRFPMGERGDSRLTGQGRNVPWEYGREALTGESRGKCH